MSLTYTSHNKRKYLSRSHFLSVTGPWARKWRVNNFASLAFFFSHEYLVRNSGESIPFTRTGRYLHRSLSSHARFTLKVLTSAVANAENNLGLDKTKLYVKEAYVNEGQTLKRMKFGSRGHVDPIKKRTSHITIVVSERN